jgi:hypothetical protein
MTQRPEPTRPRGPIPEYAPDYSGAVDATWGAYGDMLGAEDPEMEYLLAQRELAMQERALQEAMLSGDIAKARELLRDIEANKKALAVKYDAFRNTINPYYDQEVAAAKQSGAKTTARLGQIGAESGKTQSQAIANAEGAVAEFGELIGASAGLHQPSWALWGWASSPPW